MSHRFVFGSSLLAVMLMGASVANAEYTVTGGWDRSFYAGAFGAGFATTKPFSGNASTPTLRYGWKLEGGWTSSELGYYDTYNNAIMVSPQGLLRINVPLGSSLVVYPQVGFGAAARIDDGSNAHSGVWVGPFMSVGLGLRAGNWGLLVQAPGIPAVAATFTF